MEFLDKTGLTHLWEQITGKLSGYIPTSQKNVANGVAGLNSDGNLPVTLLTTVPVNKGGTGATDKTNALNNLGAEPAFSVLPISKGGTGADNASTARTNLGAAAAGHTHGMITNDGKLTNQTNKVMVVDSTGSITAYGGTAVRSMISAEAANTCLPLAGGDMTGAINFGGATRGVYWTTANGTVWSLRPYYAGNMFQLTFKPTDEDEHGALNINASGVMSLYSPLPVASGGTGATTAAQARSNLGALTYAQYDNGYFETGASDVSAWLTYSVDGTTKCQLDLIKDGQLTVNGSIVATEGRDNTFAGTLTVSNDKSAGGYVKIWEDNEGGNIEIGSKSGYNYQIDAYNDNLRIYSQKSGSIVGLVSCDGSTGVWTIGHKLKLDGSESQTLWMRNATSDTSEVSITFYQGSTQRWTLGAGCGSAGNDFTLWDHTNTTLALDMRSNKYLYVYGNYVYDQRSIAYSSTAPTDVYPGKIWLKPA